jgi:two-component system, cell cycle response regulator
LTESARSHYDAVKEVERLWRPAHSMSGERKQNQRIRTRTAKIETQEMIASSDRADICDSWIIIYGASATEINRRFELVPSRQAYIIGRSSQCDITVDSTAASRKHCRVQYLNDSWWIVDLGSLNGTYVNDRPISQHKAHALAHGERIQVGDTIFKHLAGDQADAAYADAIRTALVTDGLTQTTNDRTFRDELGVIVSRCRADGMVASLIVIDLDHFKSVNDRFGHPAGDRVLREFAQIVRSNVPSVFTVARVGGEEFAVLLPGQPAPLAASMAEKIRAAVAEHPFASPQGTLKLTASFGVAALGAQPESATQWFERADQKLYQSKRGGRNRVSS